MYSKDSTDFFVRHHGGHVRSHVLAKYFPKHQMDFNETRKTISECASTTYLFIIF